MARKDRELSLPGNDGRWFLELAGVVESPPSPTSTYTELEALDPSFVSVTYGAGGSTRELTNDLVVRIKEQTSLDPVPVACEIVTALNSMITRSIDVFDPSVLTVGRISAGRYSGPCERSASMVTIASAPCWRAC